MNSAIGAGSIRELPRRISLEAGLLADLILGLFSWRAALDVVHVLKRIAEHFFLFLAKGTMNGYDGNKHYTLKAGESCIVRKNKLARYNKVKTNNEFE